MLQYNKDKYCRKYVTTTHSVHIMSSKLLLLLNSALEIISHAKFLSSLLVKYEKQNLKFVLNQLFNVMYDTGVYPDKWSTWVIVPIYKKGDKDDPANYRGITLTCALSKVFTFMLNER